MNQTEEPHLEVLCLHEIFESNGQWNFENGKKRLLGTCIYCGSSRFIPKDYQLYEGYYYCPELAQYLPKKGGKK